MGTELGLGEYQDAALSNGLLPNWLLNSAFQSDTMDDAAPQLPAGVSLEFLFSQVLAVAGVLHIFSNAPKDVYRC